MLYQARFPLCVATLALTLCACQSPKPGTPPPAPPPAATAPQNMPAQPAVPMGADTPQIIAAPVTGATNINIAAGSAHKVTIQSNPTLPPTEPAGTIELSGFNPVRHDVRDIKSIRADHISTDATGKMTLSGDAEVKVQEGQMVAKLSGDEIKIQTGPGFNPQVGGGQIATN